MSYPVPSAPPYYYANQQNYTYQPRPATRPTAHSTTKLDLMDNCSICSDQLKEKPEGDTNSTVVLNETQCHHFFHEFCLKTHLQYARERGNQDCPLCRSQVNLKNVKIIPVEMNPVTPSTEPKPQETNRLGQITTLGRNVLYGVAQGVYRGGSAIVTAVTAESAATIKNRQILVEHLIVELHLKWKAMPQKFQAQKESIDLALTSVRSLISTHSKEALNAVRKLETYTKTFEANVLNAQKALLNDLSGFQIALSRVVRT